MDDETLDEKEALQQLAKAAEELEKIKAKRDAYLKQKEIEKERIKNNLKCNFCGKKKSDVKFLIEGKLARICNECIVLCYEMAKEEEKNEENT